MSWVAAIRAVTTRPYYCSLPPTTKTTISSSESMKSSRKPKGSAPRKQPSIAEVQRAIGVTTDPFQSSKGDPTPISSSSYTTTSSASNPFMEFLSSTPIGQAESPAERKLREAAEWVVDHTEAQARNGQQIILVVCLRILPVWLLLLLVASGVIRLPFDVPFMDDLLS